MTVGLNNIASAQVLYQFQQGSKPIGRVRLAICIEFQEASLPPEVPPVGANSQWQQKPVGTLCIYVGCSCCLTNTRHLVGQIQACYN